MRLSRFLIALFFFFAFVFVSQSPVFAQSNLQQQCQGSPDPQLCVTCQTTPGYFSSHYEQCRIAVSGYNTNKSATPHIDDATIADFGGIQSSGNFIGGSADVMAVSGAGCSTTGGTNGTGTGSQPKTGTPGTIDFINEKFIRLLIGSDTRCITLANGQSVRFMASGAVPVTTSMMAKAFTNMPSSSEYVAYVSDSIRNPLGAQSAYAQGLGFSSLAPILGIWKLMRNLAYFFFVIVFLVIGFMIMFRQKIGSQAAVTVQQALPKLVVSLLLVTFSYAIAGLMIDLMYLIIYLMIGVFSATSVFSGGIIPNVGAIVDVAFRNNIITNMMSLIGGAVGSVAGSVGLIAVNTLGLQPGIVSSFVQGGANVIVTLVLAVYVLVSIFRVFFALLQAYVSIFFSVIFAPLQLLLGAIPGKNTFGEWIGNLFDNLIVFPTTIFILLVAFYFSNPQSQVISRAVLTGTMVAHAGTAQPRMPNNSLFESLPLSDLGAGTANAAFSAPGLGSNQGDGATAYLALISLGAMGILPDVIKLSKGVRTGKMNVDIGAIGQNLQKGWKGAEIIPGVGLTNLAGPGGIGKAYNGWKTATIGSDAYRRRQQELALLATTDEQRQQIQGKGMYGGIVGAIEKRRRAGALTDEQTKRSQAVREHAKANLPTTPAHGNDESDFR